MKLISFLKKSTVNYFFVQRSFSNMIDSLETLTRKPPSVMEYLQKSDTPMVDGSTILPQTIKKVHFVLVKPEPIEQPYHISTSLTCASELGIDKELIGTPTWIQLFCGNLPIKGFETPYAMNYGSHTLGSWWGQLGDGRALSLGEIITKSESSTYEGNELTELQLKGAGRTPFSRGFDGRAVLRSSVREYIVSEAMHHLGVPTTRALTLIGTNQTIVRPWYASTSQYNPYASMAMEGFSPNQLKQEPGAILCRTSRSFLRFGHLELFAKRNEFPELIQLINYLCWKEYPHIYATNQVENENTDVKQSEIPIQTLNKPGSYKMYIELFEEIVQRSAFLVSEWARVGYTQGNMNSDNMALGGRTIDYGPFGFMEQYDLTYQPWVANEYTTFGNQPQIMALNIETLGKTVFVPLIKEIGDLYSKERILAQQKIEQLATDGYQQYLSNYLTIMKGKKLGIESFGQQMEEDQRLWKQLHELLTQFHCDYIIFFRELSHVSIENTSYQDAWNQVIIPSSYLPNIQVSYFIFFRIIY